MRSFIEHISSIIYHYIEDEMTVYAAQASFFIILAFFPFIMLILTVIQMIPALNKDILTSIISVITPSQFNALISGIVNDLYTKSPTTVLSITIITALWSSSKGIYAMERALNRVWKTYDSYNYIVKRGLCVGYTVVFLLVTIMSLLLLVFGNAIAHAIINYVPFLQHITYTVLDMRGIISIVLFFMAFMMFYSFLPRKKLKLRSQTPGAVFSSICWLAFSYIFSIYFNNFSSFSYMYGSLTAIVLIMLWLYICICILLAGAEINAEFDRFTHLHPHP